MSYWFQLGCLLSSQTTEESLVDARIVSGLSPTDQAISTYIEGILLGLN